MLPLLSDVDIHYPQKTISPSPAIASVRLNDIFQKILSSYRRQINTGKIVCRCEALPAVEGDEHELYALFENIFSILLENDTPNTRHFLHIDCCCEEDEIMDLSIPHNHKIFHIQFKSSRDYDAVWNDLNQFRIDECNSILSGYKSKIVHNPLRSNGSSFTLSLPGKLS